MSTMEKLAVGQQWRATIGNAEFRQIYQVKGETVFYSQGGKADALLDVSVSAFQTWVRESRAETVEMPSPPHLSPGLELGTRIRLLREMAGMSQQQLADAAGISRSAVTFWETGRSGHVGKHLGRLAEVLGVEPEVLLTGMAYQEIPVVITPDENIILTLYRQLDPLTKLQAQKWVERRVKEAQEK